MDGWMGSCITCSCVLFIPCFVCCCSIKSICVWEFFFSLYFFIYQVFALLILFLLLYSPFSVCPLCLYVCVNVFFVGFIYRWMAWPSGNLRFISTEMTLQPSFSFFFYLYHSSRPSFRQTFTHSIPAIQIQLPYRLMSLFSISLYTLLYMASKFYFSSF